MPFLRHRPRTCLALTALLGAALAPPAWAGSVAAPETRLVDCEAGSCLFVTGRRGDAGSTVTVNGHSVSVEGIDKWRLYLPVDTVRRWSAPLARSITVSVVDARTGVATTEEAALPIGMLGRAEDLAVLVVSLR